MSGNEYTLHSLQQTAHGMASDKVQVQLFGSRARGDARPDSDWDVLVLIEKDKVEEEDQDRYTYPFWELGWKINAMIHPIIYTRKDWEKRKGTPFYDNVMTEGVALC